MKLQPSLRVIFFGVIFSSFLVDGDSRASDSRPALQLNFATPSVANEFTAMPELTWSNQPGVSYVVQSSTNLADPNAWGDVDLVKKDSPGPVRWMAPESLRDSRYFRLVTQPAIFDVQPAFIDANDPNAVLYILGQLLPTNATVIINGQSFTPTVINSNGVWATVSLNGLPPGTTLTGTIFVVDNATATTNSQYKVQSGFIYATSPGISQLQGPPDVPPASPQALLMPALMKAKEKANRVRSASLSANSGGYNDDSDSFSTAVASAANSGGYNDDSDSFSAAVWLSKKGYESYKALSDMNSAGAVNNPYFKNNVMAGDMASGTVTRGSGKATFNSFSITRKGINAVNVKLAFNSGELQCEETDLATPGRALDFAWMRTYRSRTGATTPQGAGWDFSFNVSLAQNGDGTLTLRPGNGRADTFYPDGTNGWFRDEYFCQLIDLNGDSFPDVLFADTSKWIFNPLGTAAGGKLAQIIDRNGNTISLGYDSQGLLTQIVDDLGRTNTVAYDTNGRVAAVTDFSGRSVRYEYDVNGDLVSVISPAVTGTPTGNDFPGGITNRYTYTSGFPIALSQLNHNLATCVDGKGQTWLQVNYQPTNNPASIDFDRVDNLVCGQTDHLRTFPQTPSPVNHFAVSKIISHDGEGNVSESFFDSRGRCVRQLDYTGRCNPGAPVTESSNRPTGKLRADDPDYFETKWTWNADSLCTSETLPDGGVTECVYQRAYNQNSARSNHAKAGLIDDSLHNGDLRVIRCLAPPGTGADLDGDGLNDISELAWRYDYDPRFGSGMTTSRNHNPWRGILSSGAGWSRKAKAWMVNNYESRACYGQKAKAWRTDNTGSVTDAAISSARGSREQIKQLGGMRIASGQPRIIDNKKGLLTDFCIRSTDPRGIETIAEYDGAGNATTFRMRKRPELLYQEWDGALADCRYNTYGQLTAITNAPDANGYRRVDSIAYHGSGSQTGWPQSITIDESGVHLTSSFEYDAVGNLTRCIDPRTNDWLFTYNALGQLVRAQTPTNISARCKTDFIFDAAGNVQDAIKELRDANDAFVRDVTTHCDFDALDRCTALAQQVSSGVFITNKFSYNANDQLTLLQSPLAASGVDPHATMSFEYDERGLPFREIGAAIASGSATNQYDYDSNGACTRVTKIDSFTWKQSVVSYDGFHRGVRLTDAMGNATDFTYDRNGNCTLVRCFGETNDVPGSAGNRLLAETHFAYDSLDRCNQAIDSFFDIFTLAPIGKGTATTTFTYAPNGECTGVTDDNGHAVGYLYDTAGRQVAYVAKSRKDMLQWIRDRAGNVISEVMSNQPDGGGAPQMFSRTFSYDALNRCVTDADNVGNTNRYAYDSRGDCVSETRPTGRVRPVLYDDLGRCVLSAGDLDGDGVIDLAHDSWVAYAYDANSRCISETDANTNSTYFAYDSLGNCTAITNADGTTMKLIWSPRSNLMSTEDATGTTVTNTYNLRDKIIHRDIAARNVLLATTTFENYAYDGFGRCVSAQNDSSTSAFAYDSLGNCIRSTQDNLTTTCVYDGVGNLLSMTSPSGRIVSYTFNANDDVSTMSSSAGGGSPPVTLATYSYAGIGRISGIVRANGINTTIQWDGQLNPANAQGDFGWLQMRGISHGASGVTAIDARRCYFDRAQNRISRTQIAPALATGLETNIFQYDIGDRLLHFSDAAASEIHRLDFSLDKLGNRLSETNDGVLGNYSLLATIPPGDFELNRYSSTPYAPMQNYDANGNLQVAGNAMSPTFYAYDYANRLVQVSALNTLGTVSPVASYTYDALGRRVSKTVYSSSPTDPPVTTYFVKKLEQCDDGNSRGDDGCDLEERNMGGGASFTRVYCWGGSSDFVCFNGTPSPQYAHCDDLGNLLALTDASGAVLERYSYDAFGTPTFLTPDGIVKTSSTGGVAKVSDFGMSRLFRGMVWEESLGLYCAAKDSTHRFVTDTEKCCWNSRQMYYNPQTGHTLTRGNECASGVCARTSSAYDPFGGNPWNPMGYRIKALTIGGDRKEFTGHITLLK